jgi:hypothetical protein
VVLEGEIDGFPAYEVYVTNEQGVTTSVYQFIPPPENNPFDLFPFYGDENVHSNCNDVSTATPTCGQGPR